MKSILLPRRMLLAAITLGIGISLPVSPDLHAATSYQKQLLRLHNIEREKRNRPRLYLRASLNKAAEDYALLMDATNHFDHTGPAPDYLTFDQRIEKAGGTGFKTMGENIAYGQPTPRSVTMAWMNSSGHRRNLLYRNFRYVGFGKAGGEPYWVTDFGG